MLWSICFFTASAPFLILQILLWLVSEMPRPVLTLEGGRGEEKAQRPPPPNHCSVISRKSETLQILRRTFTDLNDLGKGIVLLST